MTPGFQSANGLTMFPPDLDDRNFDAEKQHWKSIRVYYEDTDFTGFVYHANYLRFFERGRSDHLRDAGVSHQSLLNRPDPAAFTIVKADVDFRKAAHVDDMLWVRSRYLGVKGARITFQQDILCEGVVICEAKIIAVMIHADGRPRKPIPEISERLASVICQPV
jgi:acyl-CoA thioester hydrolase